MSQFFFTPFYHYHGQSFFLLKPSALQYPPMSSRLTNLLRIFDRKSWVFSFLSIFVVHNTLRLLCYLAKRMGYITLEEEILMWPFRYFGYWIYQLYFKINLNSYNSTFFAAFRLKYLSRWIRKESLYCRVDFPVDSLCSDYIQSEKQRKHNNYLKIRKTAKRGLKIPFGEIFRSI